MPRNDYTDVSPTRRLPQFASESPIFDLSWCLTECLRPTERERVCLFIFVIVLYASVSAGADLASAKRDYEKKDYAAALKEFTPLAQLGNADAQLFLGRMYMMGEGVPKDSTQALKWFKASAAQGNADAQFFVGSTYLMPRKNVSEGVKWLRLSAEQGNQDAQWLLGKAYLQGDKDLPRDAVQAEMWLRLAAKNNLEFYQKTLLLAERQISADEIAKGKVLAEAWTPKRGLRPES